MSKFRGRHTPQVTDITLTAVNGDRLDTEGRVQLPVDKVGALEFIIMPGIEIDGIIGCDFLDKYNATVDFARNVLTVGGRSWNLQQRAVDPLLPVCSIGRVTVTDIDRQTPGWLEDLKSHSVFREELGHCVVGDPLKIETTGGPIRQRPYRQPLTKRRVVEEELEKMLALGVIRPSTSEWASPITLVPKKDGSVRFCVDYRRVNALTRKDGYPLPHIQEIFDLLGGSRYFTTLDVRSGYWQCDLDESSIPKSAFVCHRGLYEWVRIPFGLANAPGQFQRLMDVILGDLIGRTCMVYIDDIVIFSRSPEEHRQHVEEVLERINAAGMTLKLPKCSFGQSEVKLLGYTINGSGIAPQEEKTEAIRNLPVPTKVRDVRAFLGMAGYYRQCVPAFADIAAPLVRLTRKNAKFTWDDACQAAFDMLKEKLVSADVMIYPDKDKPYILHTDASDFAVGAILTQDVNGLDRHIQYVSKALTESQRKWPAITKEAYAIVFALQKLRPYLQGARFTVWTDHKPLKSLFSCEIKNSMVQRWAMQISEFGCDIQYRKGAHNVRADMLSRIRPRTEEIAGIGQILAGANYREGQQGEFPVEWAEAEANDEGEGDYIILGGELYSQLLPYGGAVSRPRVMVPEAERTRLIDDAHEELGHRSWLPVLRYLQGYAVWPRMTRDIKARLDRCPHCQGNRQAPPKSRLQLTETPGRPWARVGVDLSGPLPATVESYRYLLAVVDHLTGFAEAIPLPDKRAATVWAALDVIFARYGYPEEIVTDNGSEFTAAEIRAQYEQHGIRHLRTTALHPQSNGATERFHRTIKDTIRRLSNNRPREWAACLNKALWAYRISPQATRGNASPYEILFGQPASMTPLDPDADVGRHEQLLKAQRLAHQAQSTAKRRRQQIGPQGDRIVTAGDFVTVNDPEVPTFGHKRQHLFRVVARRGKVVSIQLVRPPHARPAAIRHYSIDRVRVVPDGINWEAINPRLHRQKRGQPDARTVPHPEAGQTVDPAEPDEENQSEREDQDDASQFDGSEVAIAVPEATPRTRACKRGPGFYYEPQIKRSKTEWVAYVREFCQGS